MTGSESIDIEFRDKPTEITKALVRGLNRSVLSGRTLLAKNISSDTGLASSVVKEAVVMREASMANPSARIASSLKRIPLVDFNAKGPEPSRGRGRGVTARLSGGTGRYPHAFIATMKSGHRGVFERVPGARRHGARPFRPQLPVYELKGPSIGHVFSKHRQAAVQRMFEAFEKTFDSEMKFRGAQPDSEDLGV